MANLLDNLETMVKKIERMDKEKSDSYKQKINEIRNTLNTSGNNILAIIDDVADLEYDMLTYMGGLEKNEGLTLDLYKTKSPLSKARTAEQNSKPEVTETALTIPNHIIQPKKVKLDCNVHGQTFFRKREVLKHKRIPVVLSSDRSLSIPYEYREKIESMTIPEEVKQIAEGGFAGCSRLKHITIPKEKIRNYTRSMPTIIVIG